MEDYVEDAVALYKRVAGVDKLKHASTPFCPDGSLSFADEETKGELSANACQLLMKGLWLARLARPDQQKAIANMATKVNSWSRNDDKRLYRFYCYMNSSKHFKLIGRVGDGPDALYLVCFVDADFSGEDDDSKSTSGGYLVLVGPNTFFPLAWVSKRQTSTARSTTESEMISLANFLFAEVLPMMDLWDILLGRNVSCTIMEDNQATIQVAKAGYSQRLRHTQRVAKVNLGSVKETLKRDNVTIQYIESNKQAADVFTKALAPLKWPLALKLLGIETGAVSDRPPQEKLEMGTPGASALFAPPFAAPHSQ
jgi:hypothetical protein